MKKENKVDFDFNKMKEGFLKAGRFLQSRRDRLSFEANTMKGGTKLFLLIALFFWFIDIPLFIFGYIKVFGVVDILTDIIFWVTLIISLLGSFGYVKRKAEIKGIDKAVEAFFPKDKNCNCIRCRTMRDPMEFAKTFMGADFAKRMELDKTVGFEVQIKDGKIENVRPLGKEEVMKELTGKKMKKKSTEARTTGEK